MSLIMVLGPSIAQLTTHAPKDGYTSIAREMHLTVGCLLDVNGRIVRTAGDNGVCVIETQWKDSSGQILASHLQLPAFLLGRFETRKLCVKPGPDSPTQNGDSVIYLSSETNEAYPIHGKLSITSLESGK